MQGNYASHIFWQFPTRLFQTWLFAIFTRKRSFALFCALLRSFADLRLRSSALICALLCSFACFCVRPRLERPCLELQYLGANIGQMCGEQKNHGRRNRRAPRDFDALTVKHAACSGFFLEDPNLLKLRSLDSWRMNPMLQML